MPSIARSTVGAGPQPLQGSVKETAVVPPSSSKPLGELTGSSDYSTHEFQGGHIGIYVSGTAQRQIPDKIAGWLRERDK